MSPSQFKEAFLLLPICMLVAFILSLLLRETVAGQGAKAPETTMNALAN